MATDPTTVNTSTTLDGESSSKTTETNTSKSLTTSGANNDVGGVRKISKVDKESELPSENATMTDSRGDPQAIGNYSVAAAGDSIPASETRNVTGAFATDCSTTPMERHDHQSMDASGPPNGVIDSSTTDGTDGFEPSHPRKRTHEGTPENVASPSQEFSSVASAALAAGIGIEGDEIGTMSQAECAEPASKRYKRDESELSLLDPSASFDSGVNREAGPSPQHELQGRVPSPGLNGQQSKKVNNEQWDAMFKKLIEYKEVHGDCLVPKRYSSDPRLGTWVETQRVQYKRLVRTTDEQSGIETVQPNKRLNADRLRRLESIGFAWSAKNIRKQSKHLQLQILQDPATASPRTSSPISMDSPGAAAATSSSGGSNPKKAGKGATGKPRIGNAGGRKGAAGGTNDSSRYDVLALSSTNTALRAAARQRLNDAQWDDMYNRLKAYKEQFGNCLVPRKYEADPKLATWVETQRVLWNRDLRIASTSPSLEPGSGGQTSEAAIAAAASSSPSDSVNRNLLSLYGEEVLPSTVAAAEAVVEQAGDDEVVLVMGGSVAASSGIGGVGSSPTDVAPGGLQSASATIKQQLQVVKRLTPDRKKKLDDLGFVWSLRSKRIEDHWDDMFRQLVEYKERHGDCLVPSRYEDNLKLGKWVETQRYEYTKLQRAAEQGDSQKEAADAANIPDDASATSDGTSTNSATKSPAIATKQVRPVNPRLTEDRLRRLESIGFEWKVKHKMKRYYDKQWDQMFERLLAFKAATGHCMVPKRYPPDMKLGTWVHTQRIQYRKLKAGSKKGDPQEYAEAGAELEEALRELKKGSPAGEQVEEVSYRLTDARRKRLEEVGFVWSAREGEKGSETGGRITRNSYDDQWDSMFEKLKEYKEMHGDCLVPKRYKEFPKLGTWVDTQRVQFKKLKKKLASQGRSYEGPVTNSDDSDSDVDVETTSSTDNTVPAMSPKPLVGRLTDDRIRRLQSLGFVWSLRDDWQKHYEELKKFKAEHGHCNVPARYNQNRRLGIWVSAQRQQYKIMNQNQELDRPRRSAPLTQDRIDYLNAIGFTWTIRSRDSLGESWNQRLEELKQFKATYGHCLVPSRYTPNPELGIWVGTQRTQYRLHKRAKETGIVVNGATAMNEDRIRELEGLGFVWALRGGEGKLIDEGNTSTASGAALNTLGESSINAELQAATVLHASGNPVGGIEFSNDEAMKDGSNIGLSHEEI